jgi:hypothetical protein
MDAECSSEAFITGAETILFTVPGKALWPTKSCRGLFPLGLREGDEDSQLHPFSAEVNDRVVSPFPYISWRFYG